MTLKRPNGVTLVYLANGVQGSAIAREALRQGRRVRAIVRDAVAAEPLAAQGAEIAVCALEDRERLDRIHEGVTHIVLQLPLGDPSQVLELADIAVGAARKAGSEALVLKLASASRSAPCGEPSFVLNSRIEAVVRGSGLPHTVVRPTMYLENLLKPGPRHDIASGLLEMPLAAGQRIAWTSAQDCATAAVALLGAPDFGDHLISGPESVTGDELAGALSAGLGREVRFRSQSVEAFEGEVAAVMGGVLARTIASKFRYFRDHPADADAILAPAWRSKPKPGSCAGTIRDWIIRHRSAFDTP